MRRTRGRRPRRPDQRDQQRRVDRHRPGSTQAGNAGPGADGGPVLLSAQTNLTVSDALTTSGSNANGDAAPPRSGGSAGDVLLRAATGALTLGDTVRADGGGGAAHPVAGNLGGPGGHGGRIDIVTATLGPIVSLSTHGGYGGDNGDDQGPGGNGGAVNAWTDAPLFDDQRVVDTDGGDGNPMGGAGAKTAELSPSAPAIDPATGVLSFTSRSPDAPGYRVLRSVGGRGPGGRARHDGDERPEAGRTRLRAGHLHRRRGQCRARLDVGAVAGGHLHAARVSNAGLRGRAGDDRGGEAALLPQGAAQGEVAPHAAAALERHRNA